MRTYLYRVTLDAYNSRPPITGDADQRRLRPPRARVRLYVSGTSPRDALNRIGTLYVRHSDGVVTRNGGLGHDPTAVSLPEWTVVVPPRVAYTTPDWLARRLTTGGTVAGMIVPLPPSERRAQ